MYFRLPESETNYKVFLLCHLLHKLLKNYSCLIKLLLHILRASISEFSVCGLSSESENCGLDGVTKMCINILV